MKEVFINVYLGNVIRNRWRPVAYGYPIPDRTLDEILIGDPEKREKNRQEYMSKAIGQLEKSQNEQIERHVKRVLSV